MITRDLSYEFSASKAVILDTVDIENMSESNHRQGIAMYNIFVPLNLNDGEPVSESKLKWVRSEILHYFGAGTILPPSDGLWVSSVGQIFHDRVMPIWVAAPVNQKTEASLYELAYKLATLFEQEEIFIYRMPISLMSIDPV
ncbi:MAG: hypothetical protein AAF702_29745 [Chloroflexota bacterium]